MDYVTLGRTGLRISRVVLGCMGFGSPAWAAWVKGEAEAAAVIDRALDLGITTFDLADVYSLGASEEIVGRLLAARRARHRLVIATKLFNPMSDDPNDCGLSRKHVFDAIDASLRRLGTDHVDLWQIHRFDRVTPLEETLDALDAVVRAGKVRYLGASSMFAWPLRGDRRDPLEPARPRPADAAGRCPAGHPPGGHRHHAGAPL
jgi:aryl-alcohol dehydrogenase-like predicted oxidoreductase